MPVTPFIQDNLPLSRLLQVGLLALLVVLIYYVIHIGNSYVEPHRRLNPNYHLIGKVILAIIGVGVFYSVIVHSRVLSEFVVSMIIALFLAYIINPAVDFFQRKWRIPRWGGVLVVYFLVILVLVLLAVNVVPRTTEEFSRLISNLPEIFNRLRSSLEHYSNEIGKAIGRTPEEPTLKIIDLEKQISQIIENFQEKNLSSAGTLFSNMSQIFAKMINVVMVPILTFFFVVDNREVKKNMLRVVPEKYREDVVLLGREINRVMNDFVRGRMIMALFVGVATMIMLLLFRVEFAVVIGFVTMIADIIPYIGPFLGLLPAVVFAFMSSPLKALWVLLLFVLIQWVENNIVAPKVLSTTVGLHPAVVFVTIILAGRIWGVLGMILAVPLVAIGLIVVKFLYYRMKERRAHQQSLEQD